MTFKPTKLASLMAIAGVSSLSLYPVHAANASDWIIDGASYQSTAWNDFQDWEYDNCLRDSPAYIQDRQFKYVALNNNVDVATGSAHIDAVDYDSGHDILPLKLERIYKTAGSFEHFGRVRTQWFSSLEYGMSGFDDAIKSAKSAAGGGIQEPNCDGYYGWGDRPLVLARGTAGALSLYGKVNSSGVVEWYQRKSRASQHSKVNLIQNSDGIWIFKDAETGTIQRFNQNGRILSITDAATRIRLTWSYASNYTKVTRSGGEWLKINSPSNGHQVIETSGGAQFRYIETTYNGGLDALKVEYPADEGSSYSSHYIIYSYNNDGLLLYENVNGKKSREFNWNSNGLVTSHKVDNELTTFSYSGFASRYPTDTRITVTNSEGRQTQYTYDGSTHNLKQVTGSGGGLPSTTSHINGPGHGFSGTVTETDALNNKTRYQLDDRGWEISRTEAYGAAEQSTQTTTWLEHWHQPKRIETETSITKYSYYSSNRPLVTRVTLTDKVTGQVSVKNYSYNFYSNGRISQVAINGPRTDIQDISYQHFSGNGRLTKTVDELGHTTYYGLYDNDGHYTRIDYPDGSITTLSYNDRGHITSETVSNNQGTATTSYEYDTLGRVVNEINPAGISTQRIYDAKGSLHQETRGDARKFYYYDTLGKLARERTGDVDPDIDKLVGKESCQIRDREEYNCFTYTVEDSFTEKKETVYNHDALGRLIQTTDSRGKSKTYKYDVLDRLVSTTDESNVVVEKLTYDSLGRVKTLTDAVGRTTHYQYDSNDNVIHIQDNANRTFNYQFNGFGDRISSDTPAEGQKAYTYDKVGNLTRETLHDGNTIDYDYDALNRQVSKTTSDGTSENFNYDTSTNGTGLLGDTSQASGTTTFTYNSLTRDVTEQNYSIDGKHYQVNYSYDSAGRVKTLTYPSGYQISYSYHADNGTVIKVSDTIGNTLASNIQFYPFGPIKSYHLLGNGQVSFQRDKDYRLTMLSSSNFKREYRYDNTGMVAKKLNGSGHQISAYQYFDNGELKSETHGSSSTSYTYDSIGNRLTANSIDYRYNADKLLSHYNGTVVRYDARNNVRYDTIHGGATTRQYNALNQLTQSIKAGKTTNYQYNAFGQRTVKSGSYGDSHFLYDINGRLLAEYKNGNLNKEFIYLGDTILAVRYQQNLYLLFNDVTGRPELATNRHGAIAWAANNKAFNRTTTTDQISLNIGYPGQYYDKETDTWYNLNRDYDPKTGRYLQSDPQGTVDGPNTYVYAGNNPVNRVDPTGEYFWAIVGAAVDIGLQAHQHGWDFAKVDYVDVALNQLNPTRFFRLGAKGVRAAQEARQASVAAKPLSTGKGVIAQGGKKVAPKSGVQAGDGVPKGALWSSTKNKSAVENAFGHFKKHKSEFPELQNSKQYVEATKKFLDNPPKGTFTKTNSRGDTLRYDPNSNTFGVLSRDGAPRTMFRPKDGIGYWNGL